MQTINYLSGIRWRQSHLILLIICMEISASILMYWITEQGPGVSPDSTIYIETAQNFLEKQFSPTDSKDSVHYPPAYPLLLSLVSQLTRGDILLSSRLLGAFLFGVNLILFSLAVYLCTKHNLTATICAMLIFLFSAPVISVHSMVWSEAPFITFSTACFILFSQYISHPRKYYLLLASLMAGFAAVTRYVGVVILLTIPLALILLDSRFIKDKAKDIFLFTGIAVIPLASWIVRNIMIGVSAANREFVFHPVVFSNAKNLITATIYNFILPIPVSQGIKEFTLGLFSAFFIFGFAIVYRKIQKKQISSSMGSVLSLLCLMYSLIYIFFVVISISFFDANTPLDFRILLPPSLALATAGITLAWSLSESLNRSWIWRVFIFFALLSVCINTIPAITTAMDINQNGRGYTSRYWKNSGITAYLYYFPKIKTIYSNGPDVIRFLAKKDAVMIPEKMSADTFKVNDEYEKEMNLMLQKCIKGKAVIVYYNQITWRWYLPAREEIESAADLPVLERFNDGIIWGKL